MPLHPEILARINALGGDTRRVTGTSLAEDLASITFDTVLYQRPTDTPWAGASEQEPIYGLDNYIAEHADTLAACDYNITALALQHLAWLRGEYQYLQKFLAERRAAQADLPLTNP